MRIAILIAAASLLPLAACGDSAGGEQGRGSETGQPERIFAGTGEVTALTGDSVTIDHGPIAEIGWPAMTMAFIAPSPDMVADVAVGNRVRFEFRESDGDYVLTSIRPVP